MSELSEIQLAQNKLEETFSKRMAELEAQLQTSTAKDTVAKVADEFRTFRELMFSMLSLLRQQISECVRSVDAIETRHRKKALLILGVTESEQQDNTSAVIDIVHKKMGLGQITPHAIRACYRIGVRGEEHHRPILVWFSSGVDRTAVWQAKSKLRGSQISIKEFLTRPRQLVFTKARQHFSMRSCWTQDGSIIIKVADGSRQKITTMDELVSLMSRFPKAAGESTSVPGTGSGAGSAGAGAISKRKH